MTTSRPLPEPAPGRKRLVLHTRVVTGAGGGPEKTILNSPRFLGDRGYEMVCAYMRPPGDPGFAAIAGRAAQWGTAVVPIADRGPLDWDVVRQLDRLCAERRPAIWHAHDYKSNLLGLMLARRHPMRLVTTVHGWVERNWKLPVYYAVDRFTLPRYERVICVSEDLEATCLRLGVRRERCAYVPNAIDLDDYTRTRPSASAKADVFGDPRERLVIGAAGRLSAEKGFDHLIRAFAQVRERHDARLWIAGEGNQRPALEALVAELGLGERVRLLGFVREMKPLFEASDLFVLSSVREGIPNVVLEAMAMEVPVIATRIAGVPAVITDAEHGQLVAPGAPQHLADAMTALLADRHRRARFARAARRHIEERFSFARRMDRIGDLYDGLAWRQSA